MAGERYTQYATSKHKAIEARIKSLPERESLHNACKMCPKGKTRKEGPYILYFVIFTCVCLRAEKLSMA